MSGLERLVTGAATPNADMLISRGISHAMGYREHPAAFKIPGGVGMLAAFQRNTAGAYAEGLVAAVITDDNEVITESHKSDGMSLDRLDRNTCWGYRLTGDTGLTTSDGFDSRPTEYNDAHEFWRNIMHASGARYLYGAGLLPSEEREIALRLNFELGHGFIDPRISQLAAVALGEP